MSTRKRNDNQGYRRGAMGIDNDLGGNYTEAYNSYQGSYYKSDYPGGTKGGSEGGNGRPADERSYAGAYTTNDSGLTNVEDFQFTAGVRDIFDDVNANSDIRGDSVNANSGPVRYGVNKSQFQGPADSNRAPSSRNRGRRS